MNSERWQKVKGLFDAVVELAPRKRKRFLDKSCGTDDALRRDVEKLLASFDDAESFMESPAAAEVATLIVEKNQKLKSGQRVANYEMLRQIGEGGMGIVYLAVRDDEIKKRVALKVIKRGMDTDDILRRFRNERQILASLDHPFIARLLDGGTTEDGLPFFVMEYIAGLPLLDYCERHNLDTTERLKLFRQICAAVAYAHQNLVVHRDLKPSNIIVQSDGTPKLLDFGIAKMLNPEMSGQTLNPTATAIRLMTPEYASPEQVRGEQITTVSDVYSLGVLLYELLTGQRPYEIKNRNPLEIIHTICDSEPKKPSTAIISKTLSDGKKVNPKSQIPNPKSLRGDIDNIVLMAMRKEPSRRYPSVEKFSEDIRRHLAGLPVAARPNTFGYRVGKFVGRNRAVVALASVLLILFIGFAATEFFQSRRLAYQRDRAEIERQKAEKVSEFLTEIFRSANPAAAKGKDLTARELLDTGALRVRNELHDQPETQAKLLLTISDAYAALGLYDRAEPLAQEAFAVNLRILGKEHPQTLRNLEGLAGLKVWRGERAEAERLRRELDAAYRRLYGDDLRTAYNLVELARALGLNGKKSEAEESSREAVAIARRILPAEDLRLSAFLTAEAQLYWNKEDFAATEPLLREALRIERQIETQNPLQAAGAYGNLGRMLMNKGSLDEAEYYLRYAEKLRRDNIKDENFMIGISMFNVGDCLFQKGKYDEAEQTLRRVIEIYRRDGNGAAHLADALFLLARILHAKNQLIEAEKFYREALIEAPKAWGAATHKHAIPVNLALLLIDKRQPNSCEPMLRDALRGLREIYDEDHTLITDAESALGKCLTDLQRYAEAEPLLRTSYEKLQAKLGDSHHTTKEALNRLHHFSQAQKKP